jgi:signal transduction histidine kinase
MRSFQKSKNRFAKLLLDHRWLILVLLGVSAPLFEVIEHRGVDDPVDAHYVREILFFGIIYPISVGLLLTLLLKAQEQRNIVIRQQTWEKQFQQELHAAANWDELLQFVVHFPKTLAPVMGVSLLHYNQAEDNLKPVAESWLGASEEIIEQTAVSPSRCGVKDHIPGHGLHPFVTSSYSGSGQHGYCLPFWNNDRFVGLLHFHLPVAEQLSVEQITLFNHLAPSIALALDTAPLENPGFLQAAAARQERARVARQLHNTLGQNLSYLRLKLDQLTVDDTLRSDPNIHQDLERMRDIADEAYEYIRRTIISLQPDRQHTLAEDLLAQAQLTAERTNFVLHHQIHGEAVPIPALVQHKIMFIFREALTNVQRHARAKNVDLTITWTTGTLTVSLADDGVGFDAGEPARYGLFGLLIMQQRAEEIRGALTVWSKPGRGTWITLQYLLQKSADEV